MENIIYLETGSQEPEFNLAFEEYILNHYRQGNILILWQNRNAVIVGRNQNAAEEINRQFVDEHQIHVVRRNTGGGAVYHDMGNLNYSFITDADGVDRATTQLFLQPVVQALRSLGLDAECSGRNDILVSGKKVSGTAQQLLKGRLLHHGTLLFDSDPAMISGALNPDPTKFQSKSVKSVRSRVGNIRSHLREDMTINAFWDSLKKSLSNGHVTQIQLSDEEITQINQLRKEKYDTWDWNYGRSPIFELQNKKRWDGGLLDIRLSVRAGVITQIGIFGDFLALQPLKALEDALIGCVYREDAINAALSDFPIEAYLGSITKEQFIHTLLNTL